MIDAVNRIARGHITAVRSVRLLRRTDKSLTFSIVAYGQLEWPKTFRYLYSRKPKRIDDQLITMLLRLVAELNLKLESFIKSATRIESKSGLRSGIIPRRPRRANVRRRIQVERATATCDLMLCAGLAQPDKADNLPTNVALEEAESQRRRSRNVTLITVLIGLLLTSVSGFTIWLSDGVLGGVFAVYAAIAFVLSVFSSVGWRDSARELSALRSQHALAHNLGGTEREQHAQKLFQLHNDQLR